MKFEHSSVLVWGQRIFLALFGIFCFAYPFAVTGVAFDVRPPFSLAWAGSALLFLEGMLLIVTASLRYGFLRGIFAGLIVITLSYLIEALGVGTGFPFGVYRYTDVLFPHLPGGVPMAVMFAWVLIVFGAYGWVQVEKRPLGIVGAFLGAGLATLLDLEIEPVAAHLEHYWEWLAPGRVNYYGVPLANFVAWFVVAFVLLLLVDRVFFRGYVWGKGHLQGEALMNADLRNQWDQGTRKGNAPPIRPTHMGGPFPLQVPWFIVRLTPCILFGASLFMFGLVDITHGYYGAALLGILAGLVLWLLSFLKRKNMYA